MDFTFLFIDISFPLILFRAVMCLFNHQYIVMINDNLQKRKIIRPINPFSHALQPGLPLYLNNYLGFFHDYPHS